MAGQVITPDQFLPQAPAWETADPLKDDPTFGADIPRGYKNWNEYVKAVIQAGREGREGPRPINVYGGDMLGEDQTPLGFLQYTLGYAKLAPYLDQSDPDIQQFLQGTYYANTAKDEFNVFGDQFLPALMGLGLATGGAALAGGFSATPGAAGAAGAFAPEAAGPATVSALDASVASPILATGGAATGAGGAALGAGAGAGSAGGLLGTLGALAPYAAPLIGAGTSLIGGLMAGGAARDAAQTQADAANAANRTLLDIYNQNRADILPYLGTGYAALGQLAELVGQPQTAGPYTATGALNPYQGYFFDPSQYAFTPPNQPLNPADYQFNTQQYAFTPPSGQDVLAQDPGYQFRVQQGMRALESGAAARGGLLSGGTARGAVQFGQDLASQEYQNAYNRLLGQNQLAYGRGLTQNQMDWQRAQYGNEQTYNRALSQNQLGYERGLQGNQLAFGRDYQYNQDVYNRQLNEYLTNINVPMQLRQQQFQQLATLAGYGANAGGQAAQLGTNLGQQVAGNITGAGAAQAAGQIGAANAFAGGLTGVGNAANSFLQYQYLQNLLGRR